MFVSTYKSFVSAYKSFVSGYNLYAPIHSSFNLTHGIFATLYGAFATASLLFNGIFQRFAGTDDSIVVAIESIFFTAALLDIHSFHFWRPYRAYVPYRAKVAENFRLCNILFAVS